MPPAPLPDNEAGRLEALRRYGILDTPPEAEFDRITALAARLFDAPIALISLVDQDRTWFKSYHGTELREIQRHSSFCSRALLSESGLVVLDLYQDPKFADSPLAQTESPLRFYAGAPLRNQDGFALGTLCILDTQPREEFSDDQRAMLSNLAAMVVDELELRLAAHRVAEIDTALLAVTQGVSTKTGAAFFKALVLHLSQALGFDHAHIGLIDCGSEAAGPEAAGPDAAEPEAAEPEAAEPDKITTIAACAQGQIIENFAYPLRDTPCQQVLQRRALCCYPSGVRSQFPQAARLSPLPVDSYAAIPFFDPQGNPLGLLEVMDSKPLANGQLVEALLPIFALRIGTELARQRTDEARQRVQQDLEHLVAQRTTELSRTNQHLHREIAERQQTEIALKKEQEMLRVLLDNVQAGIVACDAEGRLTLFNQAARDFHGLPVQPLPPDQWASHYDLYTADGQTPLAQADIPLFRALREARVTDVEMVIAPQGGVTRTVLTSGQAIATADGQIQGAVVVMHDITERKRMEETLRASEARLSSIFETIPDGILMFDRQGQIVTANSAAEDILRLSRDALAELTYNDLNWVMLSPDGDPIAEADLPFLHVIQTGQPVYSLELAITHGDGETATLCLNASPLFDASGEITHVVASLSDITERKRAELALQSSEERYRSVIETTAEGIVLQHADGSIHTCNASAAEILGLTVEQMSGRSSLDPRWAAIHEDGSPFPGDQHPGMVTLRTGESQTNVVMGVHKPDGTLTWISINTRPLFEPDNPQPIAVVASFFDITDRKLAEAERAQLIGEQAARLNAERGQFRSDLLVDISIALGSLLTHTDTLKQVADRVVPFFGDWCVIDLLHPDQSIERVAVAHCDPGQVELAWQIYQQYPPTLDAPTGVAKILRTGQTELISRIPAVVLETMAQDPEHLRLLQSLGVKSCIVAPLMARGQVLGAIAFATAESNRHYGRADLALAENIAHQIAIAVDNTRLYQAEQAARSDAEAANRIKDEFLAVLSHELRSPLNPILGWSQLLQKRQPDAITLARGLETIERNAKLQTQLIADLLDVSRILQGKLSLEVAPVRLQTTVEAAIETVRLAAEAKAIQIRAEFDPDLAAVLGDAGRLQQVVWNLLANAVKFTPEGGEVEIRLESIEHRPGGPPSAARTQAQITVTDTGKGIAPEFLPYIFERFRQADSKTTRKFGGLGLGLAIARQLVELHGGTIAVASPGEGMGTSFTVRLPCRPQTDEAGLAQAALRRPTQPSTLAEVSILVVEDEADARELLVFVLQQAGAKVTAVCSGREALEALPGLRFDVLISDVAMPDMDGYMLLQQIRARVADQPSGFVAVALTAYAAEIDRQQAMAAGFQRHLSKPYEPAELVAAIAALIEQRSAGHPN
ncbi:MAG: PAS domain S-box protein [Leptolyngbya sp. DLM2.Bin27]|nr:MAG: PAS domain S-box protein [Leptolyngbya sp. DLM2.Bin27]